MEVLILGQSNAVRLAGYGEAALAGLLEASLGEPVTIINAAAGGTSLTAVRPDYWLETGPGTLYDAALAAAAGASIDAVVWIQGEADAGQHVSSAGYEAALGEFLERLRADLGEVPVYLQPLILRPDVVADIRAGQLSYAADDPLTRIVDPAQDIGAFDEKHWHAASYSVIGDALARAMLDDLGVDPAWLPTLGSYTGDYITGTVSADRIYAGAGDDCLYGGRGADVLLGEGGDDDLRGSIGLDLLAGGSGIDFLAGGTEADRIFGDAGADCLRGGDGGDTLHGGDGADVMTGDAGADRFYIAGADRVRDFTAGEDIIAIKHTLQDSLTYSAGRLYAGGELLAILAGAPTLSDSDLMLF